MRELPFQTARAVAEWAGVRYATALRRGADTAAEPAPVLVWLGPDGDLREHPIARLPIGSASAGGALYLLGTSRDRRAFYLETLDLSAPDAPRRVEEIELTGVPVDSLGAFAADARRVLISTHVRRGDRDVRAVFAVDRRTGRIDERLGLSFGDASFCDGAGCALIALDHDAKTSFVAWEPHGGGPPERLVMGPYPGHHVVQVPLAGGALALEGGPDGWTGALIAGAAPRLRPLPPVAAPTGACPFDAALPGRWPGVVVCSDDEARQVLPWDAARRALGAPEPLPPTGRRQERYAAHPEGVIRVAWDGGSGMMHGPEMNGIREYHEHWRFEGGEASLLVRGAAGWEGRGRAPLALRDARGEFSRGYEPEILTRGARAAVLLSSDGFAGKAYLQSLREPCP